MPSRKWSIWSISPLATIFSLIFLSLAAADALRDAEYAKWEKMTDPYTGNEYYKHKETGEEVFEIPIRDWSDNPE